MKTWLERESDRAFLARAWRENKPLYVWCGAIAVVAVLLTLLVLAVTFAGLLGLLGVEL